MEKKCIVKIWCGLLILMFAGLFFPFFVSAEDIKLCPIGKTIGITAYMEGVCVVNTTEFESNDGKMVSPACDANICGGDIILEINGKKVSSADELEKIIEGSDKENMTFKILRDNDEYEVNLRAEESKNDKKPRIGVWIKDSSSGVGTLTYYDKKTGQFGALGHGICDENNFMIDVKNGNIHETDVASLRKGESGVPGELIAVFDDDKNIIGKITKNTNEGIFGQLKIDICDFIQGEEIPVARRSEVSEGEVTILSNIEGNSIEEYSAEITKINKDENNSKGMIIKITDKRLLDKTGGIIRGMSGSPILKDGKFVGAITHVLLNDPTRGYGIFIENMLEEANEIK